MYWNIIQISYWHSEAQSVKAEMLLSCKLSISRLLLPTVVTCHLCTPVYANQPSLTGLPRLPYRQLLLKVLPKITFWRTVELWGLLFKLKKISRGQLEAREVRTHFYEFPLPPAYTRVFASYHHTRETLKRARSCTLLSPQLSLSLTFTSQSLLAFVFYSISALSYLPRERTSPPRRSQATLLYCFSLRCSRRSRFVRPTQSSGVTSHYSVGSQARCLKLLVYESLSYYACRRCT
jgi:hypothetical protein